MSGVRHGTTVDRMRIRCLVSYKVFCNLSYATTWNLARRLRPVKEYALTMDRVSGIKVAIYRLFRREEILRAWKNCVPAFAFVSFTIIEEEGERCTRTVPGRCVLFPYL